MNTTRVVTSVGSLCSALIVLSLDSSSVSAQRSDRDAAMEARCERLRTIAASRAIVMQAPALDLQVIRVPVVDDTLDASLGRSAVQPRVALRVDAVGIGRGGIVRHRADAECDRVRAETELRQLATALLEIGRVAGLRAKLSIVEEAEPTIVEATALTERRLAEGLLTLDDADAVRMRAIELARLRAATRIELEELEERASYDDVEADDLERDRDRWEEADARMAALDARLRRLEALVVVARGGVVPGARTDWFGTVSMSLSFGALAQGRSERAAEAARVRELATSEDGPAEIARRLAEDLRARRETLVVQRESIDAQLALLDRRNEALRDNPSLVAEHARVLATLERVRVSAERAQVVAVLATLDRAGGAS